ncbi:MAG: CRISPR-associated protein Cas4 [Blastocatellia bacterium]
MLIEMIDPIPIAALNEFAYCPRRCALMQIEGIWADNEHTILGSAAHRTIDLSGYEIERGVRIVRALPVFSESLGIAGLADVVEFHRDKIIPVEYKKGKRRKFQNDDIQVCAQAMCLEEMFSQPIERGFIFHAASKRRREVTFDEKLRAAVCFAIDGVRRLISESVVPAAHLRPQCDGCSLRQICLPEITDPENRVRLFKLSEESCQINGS